MTPRLGRDASLGYYCVVVCWFALHSRCDEGVVPGAAAFPATPLQQQHQGHSKQLVQTGILYKTESLLHMGWLHVN